ncbi:MAG: hypothetical protein QXX49_02705 [Candidatus Caldarchaeum sp.]|uniref:Uncharacterized protein n=1 Tax=Caldiarchaeum subterraneum TaxID=311458 RepID=A0A7J3VU51_CALS0
MKTAAVLVVVFLGLAAFSVLLVAGPRAESLTTATTTLTRTVVSTVVATQTVTTMVSKTASGTEVMQSSALLELLSSRYPNYESMETYRIKLPSKPGTYQFSFAVFWRYGQNHSHVIIIEPPEKAEMVFMLDSLIQTRFVSSRHLPNIPAPWPPTASLTETVLTEDGRVLSRTWNITRNVPGYPSTPQVERSGAQAWVVSYKPLQDEQSGDSLVARYYFLVVRVIFSTS